MTPTEITEKLKTHEPRLLTPQEAGIGPTPWTPDKLAPYWVIDANGVRVAAQVRPNDVRHIAASSTWAELLFENYQLLAQSLNYFSQDDVENNNQAVKILSSLSLSGRLGWTERKAK